MKKSIVALAALNASPALASEEAFFSLQNTHFVVLVAFIVFVGLLLKLKVPAMLTGMLDKRSAQIRTDLTEARNLREEAAALLKSYERKQKDVQEQSERIIASAKEEAQAAALRAKDDLQIAITRRLAAAQDQIASAQSAAVRQVREQAVAVAVAAAGDLLTKQMTAETTAASIDAAIVQVEARMH